FQARVLRALDNKYSTGKPFRLASLRPRLSGTPTFGDQVKYSPIGVSKFRGFTVALASALVAAICIFVGPVRAAESGDSQPGLSIVATVSSPITADNTLSLTFVGKPTREFSVVDNEIVAQLRRALPGDQLEITIDDSIDPPQITKLKKLKI